MTTRPVPRVIVEIEGTPLDNTTLIKTHVRQQLSRPTRCELVFGEPPGSLIAVRRIAPGASLRVAVEGSVEPLFTGEVTAVSQAYGPDQTRLVRVRGYDRLHRLQKRHPVRAYVEVTPEELAQELAGDAGLRFDTGGGPAASHPIWPVLIQHGRTSWDLLVTVAEESGLFPVVEDDRLKLVSLEGEGEPVPLVWGTSLLETVIELNEAAAARTAQASGWNPWAIEAYNETTSTSQTGRQVAATVPDSFIEDDDRCVVLDRMVQSARHLETLAQAALTRRTAGEVIFQGVAEGDPRLKAGGRVEVSGVDDQVAGHYVLTTVTHTIDAQRGFLTTLSSAPPPPREAQSGARATLGIVSRVDDPEQLGRICVTLPTYADVETTWLHVLSAGAGTDKGLVVLPDVGDRVLILFPRDAVGEGIVLGGLYGMAGAYDSGVEANHVQRYTFKTPGGQRVILDDAHQRLRVENQMGSYVELGPERVQFHAAVDLDIEAPGRSVVIRAQAIDFERG